VEDLVDQEVQKGEGDGAFGFRHHWGALSFGLGLGASCTFPRAIRLNALVVITWDDRFGAHPVQLNM